MWSRQVEVCHAVAAHKRVAVKSGHKVGKPLALDTPIPTPAGWRTQGTLRPGDQVFDEAGRPCNVVGLSEIWHNRPCYEVLFSDGARIVADAAHEWRLLPTLGDAPQTETTASLRTRLHGRLPCPVDHRSVVRVDPCPPVPVRCIEVDSPSHLYLAGPTAIPTHNSVCAALLALWWVLTRKNGRVVLTAPSGAQIRSILWMELTKLITIASQRPVIQALGGLGGRVYKTPDQGYQLGPGHEIVGRSTNEPERMAGTSGAEMLYLVDEASGIDQLIFEAIEGNLTGGGRVVLFSNPTQVSGEFYDAFHSKRGIYHGITISSEETPNAQTGTIVIPGLAEREAILDHRKAWGPDWKNDVRYAVRVLGLFPKKSAYAVINLDDVARAKDRWFDLIGLHFGRPEICTHLPDIPGEPRVLNPDRDKARLAFYADPTAVAKAIAWYESSKMDDERIYSGSSRLRDGRFQRYLLRQRLVAETDLRNGTVRLPRLPAFYYQRFPLELGVDVARFGDDTTVVTPRRGPRVFRPRTIQNASGAAVAAFVNEVAHGRRGESAGLAAPGEVPVVRIDEIGEGASATDFLLRDYAEVLTTIPVRSSTAANDDKNYENLRAELHFAARDWLRREKPAGVIDYDNHGITGGMFMPLQILEDDLVAPLFAFTPQGRMKVESKVEMKKRLGRSPDHGDSFHLAVYDGQIVARIDTPPVIQDFSGFEGSESRFNPDDRGF